MYKIDIKTLKEVQSILEKISKIPMLDPNFMTIKRFDWAKLTDKAHSLSELLKENYNLKK